MIRLFYIYDANDNAIYAIDPYSSTFYTKSNYVYILTDNRVDYNNLLQFSSDSEALLGVTRLDDVKKWFTNNVSNNYVVKVSDNDGLPDVLYNKLTGSTLINLSIVTGTSEKLKIDFNLDIDVNSAQLYDYLRYDGTQWVNSAVTTDMQYFYSKIESDDRFVHLTGDTMTGDLSINTLSGIGNRIVYVDNTGKLNQTDEFIYKTNYPSLTAGTNATDTFNYSICKAVVWDYVIDDDTNFRAGTITAVWNGMNIEYNEVCTNAIGTILDSTFSFDVIISGDNVVLNTIITSGTWSVSTSRKIIG